MTARTGLFIAPTSSVGTSPTDGRLALAGIQGGARGSCLFGGAITTSASAMTVSIAQAVWQLIDPTNGSAIAVSATDPATVTPSAGPGSGSRIDSIYVLQHDPENGGSDSRAVIGIVAGTASATPSAPAVPTGALLIGTITVPTGASVSSACTVTPYAAAVNQAAAALTASSVPTAAQVPGAYVGQRLFVSSTEYRWNGTAWKLWNSDWISYTPGLTNLNLGSGGSTFAQYRYESGEVHFQVSINFGSSPVVAAGPTVTLPVQDANTVGHPIPGSCYVVDAGGVIYPGLMTPTNPATAFYPLALDASGSYGKGVIMNASIPATFASGFQLLCDGVFTPA